MGKQDELKEIEKEKFRKQQQIEVIKANERAAELKRLKLQQEKDEDMKIAAYIREKSLRDAQVQKQKEEAQARREKEAAELRAKQQKAMDNRGQLDEIRARRAQEG